jgi:KDO2-lipid IV(A) lauroyltransferase
MTAMIDFSTCDNLEGTRNVCLSFPFPFLAIFTIFMQAISYYLALPFLYLISLLPPFLFYGFSDLVFFLLYYVIGYRKKVVMQNLRNSFPEKEEAALKNIMRRFYSYLCDLFLETFRTLTMSRTFAVKHCDFDPKAKELFDQYYVRKQSIIIVMGHFGNWEWAGNSFPMVCRQQLYVIYHPLANKYFNQLIVGMRTRFGTKLIPMKDSFREMVRNRSHISATAFIADQTPFPENAYWTTFLNQETPVFRD